MQSMGLNLQVGEEAMRAELEEVKRKMVPVREEVTESRGSMKVVWTAMETGKVEVTSDATVIKGETCKLGQGMMEIIKEMKSQEL